MVSNSTLQIAKQRNKKKRYIEQKLKKIPLEKLTRESGFKQRKERKINGKGLLISFILMIMQGKNSYEQWAQQLGIVNKKKLFPNKDCRKGLQSVLQHLC